MEPINYFNDLPVEMHFNIFSKLSHATLQQVAFVNKYFFEIATANELWEVHFSIQFPDSVKLIDKNNYYKEFSKRITRRKFDCEPPYLAINVDLFQNYIGRVYFTRSNLLKRSILN